VNYLLTKFQCSNVQLRVAAKAAYEKVFGSHHAKDIQDMAELYISTLPSRSEILERLNEDGTFFYNFMTTVFSFSSLNYILIP
jgi:Glycolipid transfer protein (GLTP)